MKITLSLLPRFPGETMMIRLVIPGIDRGRAVWLECECFECECFEQSREEAKALLSRVAKVLNSNMVEVMEE